MSSTRGSGETGVPGAEQDEVASSQLAGPAERYCWLKEISRGGVGVILGARDPVLGRKVAIKVLRPDLEKDERVLSEFSQEARITGQLDHPNIVPIYDFGEGERSPYLVMKWIAGKSLAGIAPERRKLRV